MLSDASLYSDHRGLQIRDTNLFVSNIIPKMDWSQEDQDIVMDIGCGSGNSCRDMFLPSFPKVKKVVAIDILPEMIEFARANKAHEKIEYHMADIEDRNTIEKWSGKISKIVSIHCFHWLADQNAAFRNVYNILKPGGEAGMLFIIQTNFWDPYKDLIENPKWNKYLKNANPHVPESYYKNYRSAHYSKLLGDIGFKVFICEEEERTYVYPNDDECRIAGFSRSGLTSYIPDELKSDFKEDFFQGMLKHNGRSSDGRPMVHYRTLTLLIQKPIA